MSRPFKISLLEIPRKLDRDKVNMPPFDTGWADRYNLYKSVSGYPETALMARPMHVPANAPHLVETFDADSMMTEPLMCCIFFLLFLNTILMLLILLKK